MDYREPWLANYWSFQVEPTEWFLTSEDNVGAVLLGGYSHIKEGDVVKATAESWKFGW
jgi:F0F1-type ATP synthase alpha subunit